MTFFNVAPPSNNQPDILSQNGIGDRAAAFLLVTPNLCRFPADRLLLATRDWLIEMAPGAGPAGGEIIFQGPPEAHARGDTPTAPCLRELLP